MNITFFQNKIIALQQTKISFTRVSFVSLALLLFLWIPQSQAFSTGPNPYDEIQSTVARVAVSDTIPLRDRDTDFINDDYYNPFDLTPSSVTQEVEYDPSSNQYIIIEKIGDEYYRKPSYLTFEEYLTWRSEQQEKQYFNKLAGINSGIKSGSGKVDPMSKVNIENNLIDRLFGGGEVNIQPQGNIDITFGAD